MTDTTLIIVAAGGILLLLFLIFRTKLQAFIALLLVSSLVGIASGVPLEKIIDGKRKFAYMPKNFDIKKDLDEFERQGITKIWITPKVPFMIPLLAGFICTFILGDILNYIMGLII